MANKEAYNISLLDVDKFIEDNEIGEVKSQFIRTPSSNQLDPEGLFSQVIFGEIGSPERMLNFGYIDLKTKIFHPRIYKSIVILKGLYGEIMAGAAFAYFDEKEKDFIKTTRDDENGGTGYSFFMNRVDDIIYKETKSVERNDRIKLVTSFKERNFLSKYLVVMAGMRDIEIGDIDSYDEINKLYMTLISLAQALPDNNSDNAIYDTTRYALQRKANAIYDYLYTDFMKGKKGWLEDKFSKRGLTLGARNVISAAKIIGSSPRDPRMLKTNECMYGIYHTIKTLQPMAVYWFKRLFFNQVVGDRVSQIPVIDPKTKKLVYIEIESKVKDKMISSDGITNIIKRFEDTDFRREIVSVESVEKKKYNLFNVYDDGKQIVIFRDIEAFKRHRPQANIDYVRGLTYAEMFYIVAFRIAKDSYGICTRYPVANEDSIQTPKIRVGSTLPDRAVKMTAIFDESLGEDLPHYPIIGNSFLDSMIVHPTSLPAFSGDFDGDMLSGSAVLSNEANAQIKAFSKSLQGIISSDRKIRFPLLDATLIGLYSLTRPLLPSERKK